MENILKDIVKYKEKYIIEKKDYYKKIEGAVNFFSKKKYSIIDKFKKDKFCLIAEIKRASPSKGIIKKDLNISEIANIYQKSYSIDGVSVLTDEKFFFGSIEDFNTARKIIKKPVLRKEFIINECQVYETHYIKADIILLIAAILSESQLSKLYTLSEKLKLDIIVEVHNEKEIDKVYNVINPKIIGINNRNLENFEVDINTSFRLKKYFNKLKVTPYIISESGIASKKEIEKIRSAKINGALVGTALIGANNIEKKLNCFKADR